jgi:hypothetical protein
MPLGVQCFDLADAVLAQRRIDIERPRIADIALGLVPGFLAQQQTEPGVGDVLRVVLEVAAAQRRGRRCGRFQRSKPPSRSFRPSKARHRQRCEPAGERRLGGGDSL